MTVSFHKTTRKTDRNSNAGIVVIYNYSEIALRTFNHKGIDNHPVLIRTASEEEVKSEYAPYWRVRFIYYKSFEGLWKDELLFASGKLHFQKLLKLREEIKYSFIDPDWEPLFADIDSDIPNFEPLPWPAD